MAISKFKTAPPYLRKWSVKSRAGSELQKEGVLTSRAREKSTHQKGTIKDFLASFK